MDFFNFSKSLNEFKGFTSQEKLRILMEYFRTFKIILPEFDRPKVPQMGIGLYPWINKILTLTFILPTYLTFLSLFLVGRI